MITIEIRLFRIALGTLVAKLREKHEMNQADLAEKLGVSQPTVAKIERGSNGVPAEKYNRLAQILGLTLDKLHTRVQAVVRATHKAAEAIRPGALAHAGIDPRGLVRFVVEMQTR